MKKRYEIRNNSKRLEYFDSEEEVENFFFKNNKMLYSPREIETMWIISSGKRAWWALSADDYLNRRGSYYIPAVISPIEPKPVSMPGPSNLPHVGPGGKIT